MIDGEMEQVRVEGARLDEYYRRYADGGVRLAYLITGDRTLAEDLVQDAFVRLAGRLLFLRDSGGFDAYLRRTIVNLANSHFRRRSVEQRHAERDRAPGSAVAANEEASIALRDELRRALLLLPVRQRTAIVLRHYEDLSDEQIAEVLRCRVGTVRSLISRGMVSLRPHMEGES